MNPLAEKGGGIVTAPLPLKFPPLRSGARSAFRAKALHLPLQGSHSSGCLRFSCTSDNGGSYRASRAIMRKRRCVQVLLCLAGPSNLTARVEEVGAKQRTFFRSTYYPFRRSGTVPRCRGSAIGKHMHIDTCRASSGHPPFSWMYKTRGV